MSTSPSQTTNDRVGLFALLALVACCAIPMLMILGATAVLGMSLGWGAAVVLALVAGFGCVAMMRRGHRGHHGTGGRHG